MKIKSLVKIFLITLLIIFITWAVTSGDVYSASAAETSGITPYSSIKDDFTKLGLEDPTTYAVGEEKKIITIAEAYYKDEKGTHSEMVVYFYHPNHEEVKNQKLTVEFKLLEQYKLIYGEYLKSNIVDRLGNQTDVLYKTDSYNGIKKYTFGTKLNEWLLLKSNDTASGVKTLVQINLENTGYMNSSVDNVNPTQLFYQEFQFINETSNARSVEPRKTSLCVNYDVNKVTVDGKAVKLRYKTADITEFKFLKRTNDTEYTDIFYYFFNVTEEDSGILWGAEKFITEINLKYYEYKVKYYEYKKISTGSTLEHKTEGTIQYFNPDGSTATTISYDPEKGYEKALLPKYALKSIYQTQTVTPQEITLQYLETSNYNEWVAFAGGYYRTLKTTYLTLFNTKSAEAKEYYSKSTSPFHESLVYGYNFGLVYGNLNGYSSINEYETSSNLLTATTIYQTEDSYAELVGLIDITYKENGQTYYATVSATEVDSSDLDNPIPGEDDLWQDEPGDPIPHPNNPDPWWKRIIDFFKNIIEKIKTFFSSAKSIIIFSAIVLLIIFAVITLLRFIRIINTSRRRKE